MHPTTQRRSPMNVSLPLTQARSRPDAAVSVEIPQYSRRAIVAIWAAAALPMAAAAWLVTPVLADRFGGDGIVPMAKALYLSLTAALVWLILIPLIVLFGAAHELVPTIAAPDNRDFANLVESDAGKEFLSGAWGWYALILVSFLFNTVLGEELLFRGFLLPRMNGAFGRGDWVANGVLFTGYHLHVPWGMPATLLDMFFLAYPTKRFRSAWIGIAVHSAQSVVLAILVLMLVI